MIIAIILCLKRKFLSKEKFLPVLFFQSSKKILETHKREDSSFSS